MNRNTATRNTRQRQAILEELRKLTSHPTASDLHQVVRRVLPKVSLGTVYRNLERLAAAGEIQKLEGCGSQTRFDGDLRPHDHVRCVRCGCLADVHAPALDLSHIEGRDLGGFRILGHRLEFLGVCPCCRAAEDPAEQ